MLSKNLLNNYLYFSFFLIFIHLIPIGVETQPHITLVISLLLLFAKPYSYDKIKKDTLFVYLLLLIIALYCYFQCIIDKSIAPIVEFVKYAIGPIIYLALRKTNFIIRHKTFSLIVYSLLFLGLLNLILPALYSLIFGILIPRFSDNGAGGVRGITILTPEPSYFVIFQIILLITIEKQLAYKNLTAKEIKKIFLLKWIIIVLSLLTKSALVILVTIIFLIPNKINFKKVFLILLLVIPISSILIYYFFSENRLSQIIVLVYDLVKEGNFDLISFLFTQESSGGTRIIVNFLAIASVFINPFGSGLGSFSNLVSFYGTYFGLDISTHEVLGSDGINKIYPQTYFANLCNDIGIFSLLLFPIVFINNDNSNKAFNLKRNLCLAFMILFQSQITNPAFWFLIAVSKIPHDQKIFK